MLNKFTVKRPIYEIMLAHLQDAYPLEACGMLTGHEMCATGLYAIENLLQSPTKYEMDATQQLQAMLHAEAAELTLLAVYHSHPHGPAYPSSTDIAEAYYPELVQLIVSLDDWKTPSVGAFYIVDGQISELSLLIE